MFGFIKSLLGKPMGNEQSPIGNGHQALGGEMQAYLTRQFQISPDDVANLRYVSRLESVGSASSKYVRIFDITQANARGVSIRKYRDLDRCQELVLFYGRLRKGKINYLKRHYLPSAGTVKA